MMLAVTDRGEATRGPIDGHPRYEKAHAGRRVRHRASVLDRQPSIAKQARA